MLVSHEARLIILLPWKTASQTVRARLAETAASPYPHFYAFNPALHRVVHQHLTLTDFLALPEAQLGYRLAAFVRNPYDRVVSGFTQMIRDANWQPRAAFPADWIRDWVTERIAANMTGAIAAGYDASRWIETLPAHKVWNAGQDCTLPLHPAHCWTHRAGRPSLDFVGRVESFEADFARLCAAFGLTAANDRNENVSAELNAAPDANGYRYADRLTPAARRRINELFAGDFEAFGYARL